MPECSEEMALAGWMIKVMMGQKNWLDFVIMVSHKNELARPLVS